MARVLGGGVGDVTGKSGWEIRRAALTSPGCWFSHVVVAVVVVAAVVAVGGWLGGGRRISAYKCRVPAPICRFPAAFVAFRPAKYPNSVAS